MNEQREIVKASWLQHVIRKKGGTLHRKKVNWDLRFMRFLQRISVAPFYPLPLFVLENRVSRWKMGRVLYSQ